MVTLYILCGPSGAGKTTWARNFMEKYTNQNIHYVSRDEIRYSIIKDEEDYFSHEKEVFKKFSSTVAEWLIEGSDVVADATHLNEFSRRKLTQAIDRYTENYAIVYIVFDVNAETCIQHNITRNGRANVPENIIRNMCRDFRAPTLEEDERAIEIQEVKL